MLFTTSLFSNDGVAGCGIVERANRPRRQVACYVVQQLFYMLTHLLQYIADSIFYNHWSNEMHCWFMRKEYLFFDYDGSYYE